MTKVISTPDIPAETLSGPSEKLMYVGPTILDPILLSHRSVFNSKPATLKKLPKETQEALDDCFVPLSQAAAALRELEGGRPAGQVTAKYKTAQRLRSRK